MLNTVYAFHSNIDGKLHWFHFMNTRPCRLEIAYDHRNRNSGPGAITVGLGI